MSDPSAALHQTSEGGRYGVASSFVVFRLARLLVVVIGVGAVAYTAPVSGGWKHHAFHRRRGLTEAELSYETKVVEGFVSYRRITLTVRRAGKLVIDHRFPILDFPNEAIAGLTLRNVWGSSDPEALVTIDTGGNRCCIQLNVGLVGAGGRGRVVAYDFPTYTGAHGRWHDGTFEFVTADQNFDCAFTDCASASQPILVVAINRRGTRFVDVTRSRPDLIARDAATIWRYYLRGAKAGAYRTTTHDNRDYDAVGVLAPWCADEDELGQETTCAHGLAQAASRGYLGIWHDGIWYGNVHGPRIIRLVDRKLREWGYATNLP